MQSGRVCSLSCSSIVFHRKYQNLSPTRCHKDNEQDNRSRPCLLSKPHTTPLRALRADDNGSNSSLIRDLSPHHTMHTRAATQRHAPHPSMHPAGERDSAEGILSPSLSPASDRSRPAFTLPEYHANTLIPPSSTSTKPHCPPRRDPRSNRNPFTPDDKIFFIHWLRWRLREGAVPPRAVLEWELGQETPQHDEKAWKKHWDDNPLLPDQIYIAACQRAKNEIRIFEERELVLSPAPTPSVASNDELPTDRRHGRERTLGYRNNSDLPKVSASPRARRSRATEQDLRAMAHYLFEKRAVWNKEFSSHYEAWKRFGERPENRTRRSPNAWNCLARVYATKIEQYCDEYIAKSGTEGEPHEDIQRISSIN
ncbi:hypothetical protein C8Q76DRAFT_388425 [Earliella scabrosa]|nr:hypothetical protein C8Q76DRAFT_388425 [Earliella scabrosa]